MFSAYKNTRLSTMLNVCESSAVEKVIDSTMFLLERVVVEPRCAAKSRWHVVA